MFADAPHVFALCRQREIVDDDPYPPALEIDGWGAQPTDGPTAVWRGEEERSYCRSYPSARVAADRLSTNTGEEYFVLWVGSVPEMADPPPWGENAAG